MLGKREFLQQMMLRKLDIQIQKYEAKFLCLTLCKNQFKNEVRTMRGLKLSNC